ncbi:MAG TPA: hypothetical protein VM103_01535 [Candidatus Paceibacterota bacterium]|nr:hypothetical protein [Candidatus Paceibacterota bacterium]
MIIALLSLLIYSFNSPGTLPETGSMVESTSPYFWINSGGKLILNGTEGQTIQGDLPKGDAWRTEYASSNPEDTDNGLHPQNLFRLVTKSGWDSFSEQASYYVAKDELSKSSNRDVSNGLLLMSRYRNDGQTLYYAGIRVDGTAVIKKKYQEKPGAFGTYFTMAQKQIFPGTYNKTSNPNLLPHNEWIDLKLTTVTNTDNTVTLTLYMKRAGETVWTKLLSAKDADKKYGTTPAIRGAGYAGIRTDFMDVKFDNYRLEKI